MFQDYLVRIKVRLNSDLSHYRPGLVMGLEGYTFGNPYQSDTYDAVINVEFENYGSASIVIDKLDIIDEEYLEFLKKRENDFLDSLKDATNIKKYIGPRGGFKRLEFNLKKEQFRFCDRNTSSKIEEHLRKLSKDIKEEVI